MSRPDRENPKDRLEKTARELRKHRPRPSAALVARVERLAESQAERRPARSRPSRRKLVLALAATLAVAASGAVVAGELGQSPKKTASGTTGESFKMLELLPAKHSADVTARRSTNSAGTSTSSSGTARIPGAGATTVQGLVEKAGSPTTVGSSVNQYAQAVPVQSINSSRSSSSDLASNGSAKSRAASLAPITTGNRLAELKATLLLKVANRDQLSKKTAQAMKIARSLSGYVVTTQVNAPSRGVASSYLVLKVPAKRSQEALIRISELGKILSQEVSLEDVKATVTSEGNAIQALKREIASLEQTLNNQTLTAQARSQLQIQLANDRARLNSLRVQRTTDILRGRLATITLTLTTGDLPKPPTHPSRVHKAIDRAWNGLSSEISWAAMAIIVASPFLLAGVALLALLRIRRRREERRLLEK
jgi:autonomous glycyl radical cofactor GrcA